MLTVAAAGQKQVSQTRHEAVQAAQRVLLDVAGGLKEGERDGIGGWRMIR